MKLWKKLQNPYLLMGQGFILGGIFVFATQPESRIASAAPSASLVANAVAPAGAR